MTREQLLALVAMERAAHYGGNPLFQSMGAGQAGLSPSHDAADGSAAAGNAAPGALPAHSLPGEGIASEPRSGASRANGSSPCTDAPSPVETFPGPPAGEEQHPAVPRPAGVAPPCDARRRLPVIDRFWSKVAQYSDGCWEWKGWIDPDGYGRFTLDGRSFGAHRIAYRLAYGAIPDGLQIDHTCHNIDLSCGGGIDCAHRRCVNPAHLEAVTPTENSARTTIRRNQNTNKTHCIHGHPFSGDNLRRDRAGHRICHTCQIRLERERTERLRQARGVA